MFFKKMVQKSDFLKTLILSVFEIIMYTLNKRYLKVLKDKKRDHKYGIKTQFRFFTGPSFSS